MRIISKSERTDMVYAHLLSLPLRFAEPIVFGLHHNEVGEEQSWIRSATSPLLDLDGRRRIVINHHTLESYRKAVRENRTKGKVRAQIGSSSVDIEAVLLDENAASDLAILDATELNVVREYTTDLFIDKPYGKSAPEGAFVHLQFHRPYPWPATDVRPDDVLVLGGYPEFMRKRDRLEITHGSWSMAGMLVNGGAFEEFSVRFDRSDWQNKFGDADDPILLSRNLGGLSGSPVFVDRGAELTMGSSLVGFVKAYEPNDDLLIITSATNLRSDGSLKNRPPPIIVDLEVSSKDDLA